MYIYSSYWAFWCRNYPALTVRHFVVILDKSFTFCFCGLQLMLFSTSRIRSAFAVTSIWIVQNYLLWCLDYYNSLTSGTTDTDLTKLQCAQHWLAHVVTKSPPFTCSVPLLRLRHWLPVKFRVEFKICLLTYETLWNTTCLFMPATLLPSLSLGSNKWITLLVIVVKTNACARAFHSLASPLHQPPTVYPFSHLHCNLQETFQNPSLWLGLSPINTTTDNGPVMLRNCFIDFAVDYGFGCHTAKPVCAGDIGTMENWLIDWLIDCCNVMSHIYNKCVTVAIELNILLPPNRDQAVNVFASEEQMCTAKANGATTTTTAATPVSKVVDLGSSKVDGEAVVSQVRPQPRLQPLTVERQVTYDEEFGFGESDDEIGDDEDVKCESTHFFNKGMLPWVQMWQKNLCPGCGLNWHMCAEGVIFTLLSDQTVSAW